MHLSPSPTAPTADPSEKPVPPAGPAPEGERPIGYREVAALMRSARRVPFDPSPGAPRRVLWHLLALLLIASGRTVAGYVYEYGGIPWNSQTAHAVLIGVQVTIPIIVLLWLACRVITRTRQTSSVGHRWGPPLGAVAVAAAAVAGTWPVGGQPYFNAGRIAVAVSVAWLTLEVCRQHGVTPVRLGIWPLRPATAPDLVRAVCVGFIAVLASLIAGIGSKLLSVHSQQDALGITSAADAASSVLLTVSLENIVMVAAVVALLSAARRPAWQMYATASVVELAVHAYMGLLPALAFLPFWWLRVWLYRRYGMLLPLIVAHLIIDSAVMYTWFFSTVSTGQLISLGWFGILLLVADWTVARVKARRNRPVATKEPGTP